MPRGSKPCKASFLCFPKKSIEAPQLENLRAEIVRDTISI
jgi:hypothetical protein